MAPSVLDQIISKNNGNYEETRQGIAKAVEQGLIAPGRAETLAYLEAARRQQGAPVNNPGDALENMRAKVDEIRLKPMVDVFNAIQNRRDRVVPVGGHNPEYRDLLQQNGFLPKK